jgi:hypothetical protein
MLLNAVYDGRLFNHLITTYLVHKHSHMIYKKYDY